LILFPNCKINLGLHILRKREDGFHDLETIFYPLAWHDALEIIENPSSQSDVEFSSSGLTVAVTGSDNICVKAYQLLKKDFLQLAPVKMHLHKSIPIGAGLGGGSSDGAFALMLLNKKFNLGISEKRLLTYALELGSDCPFFIKNIPCHASGRGEILDEMPIDLSTYRFVLVNPRIHINTGWAFSQINLSPNNRSVKEVVQLPVENWKDYLTNDFEEAVFAHHPEVKACKKTLYELGALYVCMTGSGSTIYGIFPKGAEVKTDFPPHYFVKII
jgi:4-diphosphocytidyl-2-C-methyl-D-erythritol kinase